MVTYNTATLLDTIKRKAMIPTVQNTFTDEDLLAIADEEIYNTILPAILNTREEFYVYKQEYAIDSVNDIPYAIPSRSVGMTAREVTLTTGGIERNLPRLDIEDKTYVQSAAQQRGFRIESNNIFLFGNETGTLNIYYYLRPNSLVATTQATQIIGIDTAANTLTLNNIPTGYEVGSIIDIINHKSGFETKQLENTISAVNSTTITLANPLPTSYSGGPTTIAENNWVTLAETTPVPQMPIEFFQYLGEAVTAYIMESQGDQEGYARAQQRMRTMLENAQKTISPRVDGASKRLVPAKNRGARLFHNARWF